MLVTHHDYELSQNVMTKFADWVAYRLDGSTIPGPKRSRNYRLDPCLDQDQQISDSGYNGANATHGYDRGHFAPLATFEGSDHWHEVNFMSNITPQHQSLNRGAWRVLESSIREIVSSDRPVYVLTGAAYDESMPELPNARVEHRVPSDHWKIVATGESGNPDSFHATAFLFDQHGCVVEGNCTFSSDFRANRVPVDDVEDLTGFDFYPDLPDERQEQIESKTGEWPPGPTDDDPDGDVANVVISAMLPNPEGSEPDDEWIEVCNTGSAAADISGWTLSDGEGSYSYKNGTELAAGKCKKVYGSKYNPTGNTRGLFLANSGETVTLQNDDGEVVDECSYSDADEGEVIECDG